MNGLSSFVLALVAISCGGDRTSDLREASVAELPHGADSGSSADVIEAGSAAFDVANVADVADVAELADVSLRGDGGSPDAMLADASEERRSTQPTALTVTPPSSELEVGGSVTLTAMAAYADGSERDVTAMTTFTTTGSAVTVRGRDVVGVNPRHGDRHGERFRFGDAGDHRGQEHLAAPGDDLRAGMRRTSLPAVSCS